MFTCLTFNEKKRDGKISITKSRWAIDTDEREMHFSILFKFGTYEKGNRLARLLPTQLAKKVWRI